MVGSTRSHAVGYSRSFKAVEMPLEMRHHFSFWFEYSKPDDMTGCVIRLPTDKRSAIELAGKSKALSTCLRQLQSISFVKLPTQQVWNPMQAFAETRTLTAEDWTNGLFNALKPEHKKQVLDVVVLSGHEWTENVLVISIYTPVIYGESSRGLARRNTLK